MKDSFKMFKNIVSLSTAKKSSVIVSVFLIVCGVLMLLSSILAHVSGDYMENLDLMFLFYGLFMVFSGCGSIVQAFMVVTYADVIRVSPKAKYLQQKVLANYLFVCAGVAYVLTLICYTVVTVKGVASGGVAGISLMVESILFGISIIYYVLCYYKFIASTIGVFVCVYPVVLFNNFVINGRVGRYAFAELSFAACVIISLVILVVCMVITKKAIGNARYKELDIKALGALGRNKVVNG